MNEPFRKSLKFKLPCFQKLLFTGNFWRMRFISPRKSNWNVLSFYRSGWMTVISRIKFRHVAKLTSFLWACAPLLELHNAKPTQQRSQRRSHRHNRQDARHSDRGNKGAFRIVRSAFASRKAPHLVFTGPWRSFGWHFAIFFWIHLLESGILDRGLSLSGFHDFFLKSGGVPIVHMICLAPGQALTASSSTAHAVISQASRRDPCSAISAGTFGLKSWLQTDHTNYRFTKHEST